MKKISFVAILLSFTVLFAACNNGLGDLGNKGNKEMGQLCLTMDKADLKKMIAKVPNCAFFADDDGGYTDPEDPEEELTDLEKEALPVLEVIVKGDSDFYEVKSITLDEDFFDSEEPEPPEFMEPFVFENLPVDQSYTVFALFNVQGMTFVYGKTEGVTIVPEETVPVNVKVSMLFGQQTEEESKEVEAYFSTPQITVSGDVDTEEKHEHYFSINIGSGIGEDKKEIYGFDSYPVTFTVTFAAEKTNNLVKVYDAQEKFVKSNEAENECKIDITLNEDDEEFILLDFVRNADSQAMNYCYVEIENNASKKPVVEENYVESQYAMFSVYEHKGIYLQEYPYDSYDNSLYNSQNDSFTSFQFDANGNFWHINNSGNICINDSVINFGSSLSGYKALAVACDIITNNIYIAVSSGSLYKLLKCEKDENNSGSYVAVEKTLPAQYLFSNGVIGNPVKAFAAYNDHLFMSIGDSYIYYMENFESDSFDNVNTYDAVDDELNGEVFVVNDITVEGGVLYAVVGASKIIGEEGLLVTAISGDYKFSQRGFIAAYNLDQDEFFDELELTLNEDFNNGSVYGWTNNLQLESYNSYYSVEYYAPYDEDCKYLFGGNCRFIGRQHGKLVFTDAGFYVDQQFNFKNIRRVFVLDIESLNYEQKSLETLDLGLKREDKNNSLLYTILKTLCNNNYDPNNPFPSTY